MFKNINKQNKNMLLLENKDIKIKNLLTKPNKGGTPAKDNNNIVIHIDILTMLLLFFKSLRDLSFFKSNKKKIKNKLNNKYMYTVKLNSIKTSVNKLLVLEINLIFE